MEVRFYPAAHLEGNLNSLQKLGTAAKIQNGNYIQDKKDLKLPIAGHCYSTTVDQKYKMEITFKSSLSKCFLDVLRKGKADMCTFV